MALSTGARRIQSAVVLAESDEDPVRVDLRKKQKDDVTDSFSRIQLWRQKNAQPFHRADLLRPAASIGRSCQTLAIGEDLTKHE